MFKMEDNKMLRNFIFDVDRTLIDSYKPELETLQESLLIVTKKEYDASTMNKLTMLTTDEFFSELGIDVNSELMKQINRHWGRLLETRKLHFFEGIKEMLMKLKSEGCFLGIATSRTREELEELDELLECIHLFDIVITSDLVKEPKPSPESIEIIIEQHNLKREETIYIGDSPSDAVASKRANVKFGYASWENKNSIPEYDYLFTKAEDINSLFMQDNEFSKSTSCAIK